MEPALLGQDGVVGCEPGETLDQTLLRGAIGVGHEVPVRRLALDGALGGPVGNQHPAGVDQQLPHDVEHFGGPFPADPSSTRTAVAGQRRVSGGPVATCSHRVSHRARRRLMVMGGV